MNDNDANSNGTNALWIRERKRNRRKKRNYNKCYGISNVLFILMTDKALIFRGYTDLAFITHISGYIEYKDDKVFVFSMDTQKIYPVKKGRVPIRCCYCVGFCSDYELNDGVQIFHVSEFEVFQIIFNQ